MKGFFCIEIKVLHQWGSEIQKFCLKDTEQYSHHKQKRTNNIFCNAKKLPKMPVAEKLRGTQREYSSVKTT